MKVVLEEHGVETVGMKAKEMRELLKTFPDFKNQLEDYVENRAHVCIYYPRFHCE